MHSPLHSWSPSSLPSASAWILPVCAWMYACVHISSSDSCCCCCWVLLGFSASLAFSESPPFSATLGFANAPEPVFLVTLLLLPFFSLPSLFIFYSFFYLFPLSPPFSFLCLWSVKYNYPITSHHLSTDWSSVLTLDVRERERELLRHGTAATWLTVWEQNQGNILRYVKTHFLKSLPDSDNSTSIHK